MRRQRRGAGDAAFRRPLRLRLDQEIADLRVAEEGATPRIDQRVGPPVTRNEDSCRCGRSRRWCSSLHPRLPQASPAARRGARAQIPERHPGEERLNVRVPEPVRFPADSATSTGSARAVASWRRRQAGVSKSLASIAALLATFKTRPMSDRYGSDDTALSGWASPSTLTTRIFSTRSSPVAQAAARASARIHANRQHRSPGPGRRCSSAAQRDIVGDAAVLKIDVLRRGRGERAPLRTFLAKGICGLVVLLLLRRRKVAFRDLRAGKGTGQFPEDYPSVGPSTQSGLRPAQYCVVPPVPRRNDDCQLHRRRTGTGNRWTPPPRMPRDRRSRRSR